MSQSQENFRVKVKLIVYRELKEFFYFTISINICNKKCFCTDEVVTFIRFRFYILITEAARTAFTHFSREFVTSVTVPPATYGLASPKKIVASHILIK